MAGSAFSVPHTVSVEFVGDDALVMTGQPRQVLRFSGEPARAIREVVSVGKTTCSTSVVQNLMDLGVITPSGMTRRSVLAAGGIGLGAGVAVIAMPTVAAASSVIQVRGDYYVYDNTRVTPNVRSLQARIPGTNGAPAVDFPEGQGSPSALSVDGLPSIPLEVSSPITQFDADAVIDGTFQYDRALWEIDDISTSTALTTAYGTVGGTIPSTGPTLIATFTWGTFSYRAELTYFVAR